MIFALLLAAVGAGAGTPSTPQALLEEVQRRAVCYFWQEADPTTGLVLDRANNRGPNRYAVASLAATGFGLAALPVGVERGWLGRSDALERARQTTRYVLNSLEHRHGWLYHFVDARTGERVWNCEISSIDTALFLIGALFAAQYFEDTALTESARALFERVDFNWMRTEGGARPEALTLSHGWTPERGFLPYRWDRYAEHLILYLLGIGSPTHPLPPESWFAWDRIVGEYAGYRTFAVGPLFVHQYNHLFVDFRCWEDPQGWDYWTASVHATLANRQYCLDQAAHYRSFGPNSWGLSACDGPDGYRAYGAPPGEPVCDGTVAVLAMLASYPFAPELVQAAAWYLFQTEGERLWGRYGFADSFNRDRGWYATEVIGIDLGAALLMIENARSGMVWRVAERIPALQAALNRIGFREKLPAEGR
ncbi:MAG: hypothetical protein KatS3mg115_2613 [Candidatus Poribacteria bacterium]|nr:MAG: hypothetical protein KatS3mg115_2613 [Candidatus Poribacteria bacterium]